MEIQIKETLSRSVCGGWDRGFLESILEQIDRGRKLSGKQTATAQKVVDRNNPAAQVIHDEWEHIYELEHKVEAGVLANYYKSTGYFAELTRDILAGIVPDMRAYTKLRGNRYATRVLETYHSEPKYNPGALVAARAGFRSTHASLDGRNRDSQSWAFINDTVQKFRDRGGFIIEATDIIKTAAKGSKTYKILPIGATIPVFIEERYIKKKKT